MFRRRLAGSVLAPLCAAAALIVPQIARAVVIAQDNFESYTPGDIVGQGAIGAGWVDAWSGLNATNAASIPLRNVSAGVIPGLGQSLELGFSALQAAGSITDNNIAQRVFDVQTGTVYVGIALQTNGFDGDGSNPDFFQLYVNDIQNNSGTAGSRNSSFSGGIDFSYLVGVDPGAYILRKGSGAGESVISVAHTNGAVHRMVLKLSKSTGMPGDIYDEVSLFVDQPTEGTPDAARGAADDDLAALGATVSVVHMRVFGFELDDRVNVDNLRIATTYAEALPSLPPPAHAGDFDGDGDVDSADFVAWQTNFPTAAGATLAQGDADGDGDVDGADFVVWQTNFPFTPGPGAAPVPEPLGCILIGIGGIGLIFATSRRR